jgi:hypothetical protein
MSACGKGLSAFCRVAAQRWAQQRPAQAIQYSQDRGGYGEGSHDQGTAKLGGKRQAPIALLTLTAAVGMAPVTRPAN